ncbi:MAG: type II toxin-antitoxin system RelE/ParE family toxin [Verrucomicrobia bacterium]|nr:type II toxin-antitoxin system RelE/ParE family toxin [Verrucomicrobiota bacterium]
MSLHAKAQDWFDDCRDQRLKRRVAAAIDGLALGPRPAGCRKLSGQPTIWRLRVGEHRILYEVQDHMLNILVIRIAHRSQVYR